MIIVISSTFISKRYIMVNYAILARVEAKPGKEEAVENFLKSALALAEEEEQTISWYALKMGPSTFGIFDTFNDEEGRVAHLAGKIAAALMEHADELLSKPPVIEKVDLLAVK
jgi:quinol monooxygenase YgiN